MQNVLLGGIPKKDAYKSLLNSKLFKKIEKYSNLFLKNNEKYLEEYSEKWVKDPFHQWSRQWEYLFVLNIIDN